MAKYDDLLNEFNIENPEKKKRNPAQNSTKNPQINIGNMTGVFGGGNGANQGSNQNGGGNGTASPGRRIDWAAVGARLRALPYASIICTMISIVMGLYILVNFEAVTWAIFCFIYHLISAGLVVFVLIVIILALILSLRRRRRWW